MNKQIPAGASESELHKDSVWTMDELPAARRDELLDAAAQWVIRKGLETPAVLFLEMHKPLTTLASVGYALIQPSLMPFTGFRRSEELRLLLSKRENAEKLIERIEFFAQARAPRGGR